MWEWTGRLFCAVCNWSAEGKFWPSDESAHYVQSCTRKASKKYCGASLPVRATFSTSVTPKGAPATRNCR